MHLSVHSDLMYNLIMAKSKSKSKGPTDEQLFNTTIVGVVVTLVVVTLVIAVLSTVLV